VYKTSLSICLIGGIYGKSESYRATVRITPETILEGELKKRGHRVVTLGHSARLDLRSMDIVHVHHLGPGALRAASSLSRAALVFTSHDGPAMAQLSAEVGRKVAARFMMSRVDALVALTKDEAAFQSRTYRLQGAAHVIIPNGIDARIFTFARKNKAGRDCPWKLLYVGQLIREKQVHLLLRAISTLPANIQLNLVFHTDTLKAYLEQLVGELGLKHRVKFLGAMSPERLKNVYQSSDLVVVPSAAESLPSVVTEAMLCGTPIVATDVGGIRDQLNGYGRLVPSGDIAALAEGIRSTMREYEHFAAQSEEMSFYAVNRFSIETMVESHLTLYRTLLKSKASRRRSCLGQLPLNFAAQLAVRALCKTS
jgi:glycosyltransferase involved in cell wall biosynthesis